jgi:hypothetical protein
MSIELVKFEEFPNDPYTKAIAVLSVDGKYNVCYGKKCLKDGGQYWAAPSFGVTNSSNSKEYYEGFSMDSKKEDQKFKDFIRQCEDKLRNNASSLPKEPMRSMDEVAGAADPLPF